MGVTGLWKLIEQSGKAVPVDTLENKVLAIDISIWLHQVVKGFRDSNGAQLPNSHLLGLFHRLCKLLYYRIKPVFVFDGGIPQLKRETIEKRARSKSKLETEADKLQQLLLEALAKEKVVQQALGATTSALLSSPVKATTTPKKRPIEDEDLFKLPPPPEPIENVNLGESSTDLSDLSESDSSVEEKCYRSQYNINLQHIDVTSSHFQSLPADIRHEILTDMKELRKQSSWGRLHEMPAESNSFSSFQMNRLLRRRRVQVELEGAEAEMGGKTLSLSELESLLSEKGIVDPDVAKNQIASNEHMRYVYVRDLKKAMEKSEKDNKEEKKALSEKPTPIETIIESPEDSSESMDVDLQGAIQLSLQTNEDYPNDGEDGDVEMNSSIKMTEQQQKAFGTAASSLARGYMLEYGGLNDEQIKRMVRTEEKNDSTVEGFKFKYNNDLFTTSKSPKKTSNELAQAPKQSPKEIDTSKPIELSDESSDEGVSSDADSDFVEVPDGDEYNYLVKNSDRPLPAPMQLNKLPSPDKYKDFRLEDLNLKAKHAPIEIFVKAGEITKVDDDIFADIFSTSESKNVKTITDGIETDKTDNKIEVSEKKEENTFKEELQASKVEIKQNESEVIEIFDSESMECTESKEDKIKIEVSPKPSSAAVSDILNDLNKEMTSIKSLNLDSLLSEKKEESELDEILQSITNKTRKVEDVIKLDEEVEKPIEILDDAVKKSISSIETVNITAETPKTSQEEAVSNEPPKDVNEETAIKPKSDIQPVASTSQAIEIINERETIENAANVLKENKTEEELQIMARELNQDRVDLYSEMRKNERMAATITERMTLECMDLLRLFGVPYIVAPMEAEAQCAFLDFINLTDGTITDDSDIWLFGGQTVYKNFFDQNKLVLEFKLSDIKNLFHLDRKEMVQLSFLVGSDYTTGVHGIGSVTALEILSVFGSNQEKGNDANEIKSTLSTLRKFRDWLQGSSHNTKSAALKRKLKNISIGQDFPNERVAEAYLFPQVDENKEGFIWGRPDAESIREYAKKTFGWTTKKTDEILKPVLRRLNEKTTQQSIKNYFKMQSTPTRKTIKVSDRVRKALDKLSNEPDDESTGNDEGGPSTSGEQSKPKKPERKTKKTTESEVPEKKTKTQKRKTTRSTKKNEKEDDEPVDLTENDGAVPSTSNSSDIKQIRLPDPKRPIPQREKDKEIAEQNKLKAIEVLKNMRARKK